jgi:hypothetical protein
MTKLFASTHLCYILFVPQHCPLNLIQPVQRTVHHIAYLPIVLQLPKELLGLSIAPDARDDEYDTSVAITAQCIVVFAFYDGLFEGILGFGKGLLREVSRRKDLTAATNLAIGDDHNNNWLI